MYWVENNKNEKKKKLHFLLVFIHVLKMQNNLWIAWKSWGFKKLKCNIYNKNFQFLWHAWQENMELFLLRRNSPYLPKLKTISFLDKRDYVRRLSVIILTLYMLVISDKSYCMSEIYGTLIYKINHLWLDLSLSLRRLSICIAQK